MDRELKVVMVTNDPDNYPELADISAKYPGLVERVEDEFAVFIVDSETHDFWLASEFFDMCLVTSFLVNSAELD